MKANYDFTVRFYEFRNPSGLQCSQCLTGGQPACCDNPERNVLCSLNRCETGFRFMLRPYEAPVDTAPTRDADFPYITPATGGSSRIEFEAGSRAFLGLPNPFTLTSADRWNVRHFHYLMIAIAQARSAS